MKNKRKEKSYSAETKIHNKNIYKYAASRETTESIGKNEWTRNITIYTFAIIGAFYHEEKNFFFIFEL